MTSFDNLRSDLLTPIALPKSPRYPAIADIFKEISKLSVNSGVIRPATQPEQNCVTQAGFRQYFKLPRIVSKRLFHALIDKKSWNCADFEAFSEIWMKGQASQQIALVFAMLDFNGDGYVTRDDCHLLLSHTLGLPWHKNFEQVTASQNHIGEILDQIFKKAGQKLSFFQYRMSQQSSDFKLQNSIYDFLQSKVTFEVKPVDENKLTVPEVSMPDPSPVSNGGEIIEWHQVKQAWEAEPQEKEACGVLMQGPMYRLYSDIGLKLYYYRLKKNTLQVYRKEEETEPKYTVELHQGQTLVTRSTNIQSVDGRTFFKFSLIEGSKVRDFYHLKEAQFNAWKDAIESVIRVPKAVEEDYILGDVIKSGKKSKVQRAQHRKTNEVVVVKTIYKKGLKADELQAIRNEIEISKMCQHSNLLGLLDQYEDELNVYLVLENMQGGNLFSFITKHGSLSPGVIRGILMQIAAGLYYLHHFNIVHRDMKPDNILLTGKLLKFKDMNGKDDVLVPEVKLADYGLSIALGINEKLDQPYGTMNFAAPQILRDSPYNQKIDMYSLGVTVYMMVCGHVPFQSTEVQLLLDEIIYESPSFGSSGFSKAPSQLISLLKKLLLKDPKKRMGVQELLWHKFLFKHDKDQRKERKSCKASAKFEVFTTY